MGWKILSKKDVYDSPWITVTHHDVIDPGNQKGIYGTVHYKNRAVAILPIDDDNNTWIVGQYRFPLKIFSWEIPEGGCAKDEEPLEAAKRELREETGLIAESWKPLLTMHLSNAVSDETSYSFIARGLRQEKSAPESVEELQVKKISIKELYRMVIEGEITDALTVATVLRYFAVLSLE